MPNSVSIPFFRKKVHEAKGFDEIDSLQHEKAAAQNARLLFVLQHRKRYGLHAIIRWMSHSQSRIRFQYRKRYGLHAISGDVGARDREEGFNTASGMDCMQFLWNSLCEKDYEFQYRKRYGLHAIAEIRMRGHKFIVSIPQAVWIACNHHGEHPARSGRRFQYRKRYGLHAIGGI